MTNVAKSIAIISDTAADITYQEEKDWGIKMVPFYIDCDEKSFVDVEGIDTYALLDAMDQSPNPVKTACPSPGTYMEAMKEADVDHIFVLTISGQLSGSWESAKTAKDHFLQDFPHKKVEIVDTMSAAAGSGLILQTLMEYVKEGLDFESVTKKINQFAREMKTFFVLESLDNLMKNGRLPLLKGTIAKMLGIKPILGSNGQGEIVAFGKQRGMKRALQKLAEIMAQMVEKPEEKTLYITYAGDPVNALHLKEFVLQHIRWKEIIVHRSRGLSTAYAQRNGVVVAFR